MIIDPKKAEAWYLQELANRVVGQCRTNPEARTMPAEKLRAFLGYEFRDAPQELVYAAQAEARRIYGSGIWL